MYSHGMMQLMAGPTKPLSSITKIWLKPARWSEQSKQSWSSTSSISKFTKPVCVSLLLYNDLPLPPEYHWTVGQGLQCRCTWYVPVCFHPSCYGVSGLHPVVHRPCHPCPSSLHWYFPIGLANSAHHTFLGWVILHPRVLLLPWSIIG